ncbi:DNA polymerase I, partial [bacterium]|nr:DNA polymerase I [bacterium]
MGKTLILIDGHALAFRQYYALERTQMSTSEGTPTWAVYGFFKAIFDLLKNKELKADAIAVAFDVSHVTFRTEMYEDYKSNREAMPDPMRTQMELIYDGLRAFNIPIYTKEGYEADDVIGTISREACELGHKVLILTGDQDAFQLVDKNGCIKVILPSKGELVEYNWDKIYEKLGVYPNQVIDYKGLRGDVSDCIPGVKGIGEKTAQKLLARYGTLDAVLADCENISEKSVREKICAQIEQAKLSQKLATIIRDLDIDFDFESTKVEVPNVSEVTDFLKKLQFYTFIKNINSILSTFNKNSEPVEVPVQKAPQSGTMQLGFFTEAVTEEINKNSEIDYNSKLILDTKFPPHPSPLPSGEGAYPCDFEEFVKEISKHSCITFKIFADIKNAVFSNIIGFGFAYNDDISAQDRINFDDKKSKTKTFYIPIDHSNIENQLKLKDIIHDLRTIFENEKIKKITFDVKNQCNILRNIGINLKGVVFDVMLASYVKDANRTHDLDIQALEHLNHAIVPYAEFDKKHPISFSDAPVDNVLSNASDELASILELSKFWIHDLEEDELKIVYDIETPLSIVLSDMEYTGVTIDKEYLKELTASMDEKLSQIEGKIFELSGCPFNLNSPKQVGEVLFVKMGLKSKKKRGKATFSTSAEVLEELSEEHEIAKLILDYRKYAKLKSTYTEALPALVSGKDGRIHCSFNQTVAVTGRLSSSNPNLQNIPARTEEGNKIRNAFVPKDKENGLILSADYSQIELRLLAHITQDKNLMEAFNSGVDVHTQTASKVFDVPVEEVTKDMRRKSKAVNFGIIYGQSKYGLAKAIGISNAEAEEFINKYFATYPRVKAYMDGTILEVQKKGYVETIFGRKRYLETELSSSNAMIREFGKRAAINQPMQGTAADLMKIAMIDFHNKLKENKLKSKMIIQVHDEIVAEVYKPELEKVKSLVKEAMELNQPLSVPLVVDINIGETWKEN